MIEKLRFDKFIDILKKGKKEEKKKEAEFKEEEIKKEIEEFKEIKTTPKKEEIKEKEFLIFEIDKEFYALPLKKIKEIYSKIEIITSEGLPDHIVGFARFKKNIVPIIDISKILNIKTPEIKNYVLVEIEKKPLYLLIGDIKGIVSEKDANVFNTPFNLDSELFEKIIYHEERLIGCLSLSYFAKIEIK
ncbi:MAG: chemotaxis protein CheW [candidate division WOR-3 bacterium]